MDSGIKSNLALQEVLVKLEIERKRISSIYTKSYIFLGVAVVVAVIGLILDFGILAVLLALLSCIIGGVLLFQINDDVKKYKIDFKSNIIELALKGINESLTIAPQSGFPEYEFISSELFTTEPDRYKTEDMISGTVDKTFFYFAEAHAEYKTETQSKSGTQTHWHTIFKGIIFVADFNKKFNASTVVRPKNFGNAMGAWFSKNLFNFGNQEIIQLENTEFNNNFVTYSNNQIEARYILTPAMMERILELNSKSDETISMSFINSKMYIAFPLSTNYFEPPIHNSLLDTDLLQKDLSIVQFMHDIVHEMDLNTRIWGKE